jgi:hypothetical protein
MPWASLSGSLSLLFLVALAACDLIQVRKDPKEDEPLRRPVARVGEHFLYEDELVGLAPKELSQEDSARRVGAYVDTWIRKQLIIQEATRTLDINQAELERKILDYRFSLIGYEYQALYIRQHLNAEVSEAEIESYYRENVDNFVLKQNIVRGTFIKVPSEAPRLGRVKALLSSTDEKDVNELRLYCLNFAASYHIQDSAWVVFDELVKGSPLAEIPNKIQFLRSYRTFETSDAGFHYFLKIGEYRISDNISPIEFVRDDIKNIILNKRKVELAKNLEDEVYENAEKRGDFEVFPK